MARKPQGRAVKKPKGAWRARSLVITQLGYDILKAVKRGRYRFAPSGRTGNPAGTKHK